MTVPADTAVARVRQDDIVPGYRLVQLVGKGGMGEVHQAVQLSLGRTVAVKLLKHDLARDESFIARFDKEASALATLRHPSIVSIVDRGKSADTYYLVMEFVDGPSLRERMRDPDFDTMAALKTLAQVGRAIDYAHGRGVIHRDLKPENILFDEQAGNIPKVTDFGLAGIDDRAGLEPKHLTQTNIAMGTASYMAPEQRVDAKTAGPRADLYSLGVMLYEMLTGELPVGQFDPPSVKKPGLDKRLDAIIARCLKPAPEDRYPSVAAFLSELEFLVPMTLGPVPSKETKTRRLLRLAKERARRVARVVSGFTVAFATLIIGTVFLRARLESTKTPASIELLRDDGAQFPVSARGRLDKTSRTLTLGEGPDTITIVAKGRPATPEKTGLSFAVDDEANAGRAILDAELEGDGLRFSAIVDTQARAVSTLEPLWALFRGPAPEARSALMLLGSGGRSVLLMLSGTSGQPVLEWNLGPDKQGQMRAPIPTKTQGQALELRIDAATGDLFAIIGSGRDARVLGDGLRLGSSWRTLLGPSPRAGIGCLDGACVFQQVVVEGKKLEVVSAPPPPEPSEDVEVDSGKDRGASVSKNKATPVSAKAATPTGKPTPTPKKPTPTSTPKKR
jgi:serine/threonine protein kinase